MGERKHRTMGNPYCSGTILVLKPVKWWKLFSKVHFLRYSHFPKSIFSGIPIFILVFIAMLEVFLDRKWLSSGIYSNFFVSRVLVTALFRFEILSLSKNMFVFCTYWSLVIFKKPYYSEIIPYYRRIWNFPKPYYSEIRTDRNRTIRGPPVFHNGFSSKYMHLISM